MNLTLPTLKIVLKVLKCVLIAFFLLIQALLIISYDKKKHLDRIFVFKQSMLAKYMKFDGNILMINTLKLNT